MFQAIIEVDWTTFKFYEFSTAVSFIAIRCIFAGLYLFQNESDCHKYLDSMKESITDPIATSISF